VPGYRVPLACRAVDLICRHALAYGSVTMSVGLRWAVKTLRLAVVIQGFLDEGFCCDFSDEAAAACSQGGPARGRGGMYYENPDVQRR
jgi:hypothetical protein